jgi:hypothetical protein
MPGSAACALSPALCAVSGVGQNLAGSLFSGLTSWVADSSSWAWRQLAGFLAATSRPGVVTAAAGPEYDALLRIAPLVALGALCANVLTSLRRADAATLARDAVLAAPALVLGVVAAMPLANLVLSVVDALSAAAGAPAAASLQRLVGAAGVFPVGTPGFAVALLDLAGVLGALALWFELVMRNAVLALLVGLSPVVLAAALWAPLRRLAVRLVETFVAVALSKFVVVAALSLGAAATGSSTPLVEVTGIAVALLAAATPFTLLRLVPLVELSALHALEGSRQRGLAGARRAAGAFAATVDRGAAARLPLPPELPEDLGFPDWPDGPELEFPEMPDTPPEAPIGEPRVRGGHVAYWNDEHGPVMGWHFDE